MEVIRSPAVKTKWLEIWNHYQNIKKTYNLTSYDILSQLNASCSITFREYLSINGDRRIPSIRQGTIGIMLWDILIPGLKKSDWLPSSSNYPEKLEENICDGLYYNYSPSFINYEDNKPVIDLTVDHEEYFSIDRNNYNEDYFIKLFTIDGIVPKIREISHSYWL